MDVPLPKPDVTDHHTALAEGIADVEAGRIVSFDKVRDWLSSWGTEQELPPPTCG